MAIQLAISNTHNYIEIEAHPDHCPICQSKILPTVLWVKSGGRFYRAEFEVAYKCPNSKCDEIFIGYFCHNSSGGTRLFRTRPFEPAQITFAKYIQEVSLKFCEIYDQAHKAEEYSLLQVCGVGYRKALEFLIKDYLISKHPEDEAAIKAKPLGRCIDDDVEDPKTKAVAKRATWLGNDETHYQRLWIDKDLSDLKTLITLVLYWIEAEHLTEEALTSMPAKT
jgi:hypothetical protein